MPHSASSLPPRKRHSRLTTVRRGCDLSRLAGIHGEAMYTAPDCAACAALQASGRQYRGSRGPPLAFSWGFKGAILSRERMAPLGAAARTPHFPSALCAESNRSPEGTQKRSSPFGLPLFYFSQMTGFWRSDSTKALAFSTASARGSLTCSPVRISLQDTTPALISSSPRK